MPGAGSLSILHVLLSGGFGGSERYCLDLARRQIEAEHRVSLLLRPRDPDEAASAHDFLPRGLAAVSETRKPFDAFAVWKAARAARADVIHAHLGWSARAAAAAPMRPAAVVTLHRHYRAKESGRLDGVIRIAEWQAPTMTDYGGLSVTIPNWLPDLGEPSPEAVAAVRAQAGAGEDDILVGFVGRFHEVKGADLLVQAFRATAPDNARLALVGDGPDRAAIEALAGDDPRIVLPGFAKDAAPWYRAFDLFVMPSRFEPFGLVALEAMVAGAPVIASTADGPREIFEGTGAVLAQKDDLDSLTAALAGFFAVNPKRPARVAYDLSRFDGARAAARIEDFYRQVIARRSGLRRAA